MIRSPSRRPSPALSLPVALCLLGCTGSVGMTTTGTAGSTGTGGTSTGAGGTSTGAGGTSTGAGGTATGAGGTATGAAGTATGTAGTGAGTAGTGAGGVTGAAGASGSSAGTLMGDVTFSTPSQSFKGQLMVGMSTAIAGAQILYTTDGTLPTASSKAYGGTPLALTATTQVRAQPFLSGAAAGLVSTGLYIARDFDATSKLPILLLDDYGKGASTSKTTYIDAAVMIFEPVNGTASLANLPTVASRAGFHLRGQSSAGFPQKPYKVEFRDNQDADAKYPVMGMTADADWALIAPYYDRAIIRNPFVYTLAKDMGRQAPRTANVEVYINTATTPVQTASYQGIYWLTESVKISGHRLDIAKLAVADTAEPNITGGYVFEFNWAATDATKTQLTCTKPASAPTSYNCWSACEMIDPDPLPAMTQQLAYIRQYVQTFHDTLFTSPIGNYGQYIDVPSFVDYVILNEVTRNIDAYRRSAYFYKDRGGLLEGGPYWDYNFALGVGAAANASPTPGTGDAGWQFQGATAGSLPQGNVSYWFPKLMTDPAFVSQVKARWQALRGNLLSQASIEARINMLAAQLDTDSVARDFAKWPVSMVFPTGGGGGGLRIVGPTATTWQGQVQGMHDFLIARANWMDAQWQ